MERGQGDGIFHHHRSPVGPPLGPGSPPSGPPNHCGISARLNAIPEVEWRIWEPAPRVGGSWAWQKRPGGLGPFPYGNLQKKVIFWPPAPCRRGVRPAVWLDMGPLAVHLLVLSGTSPRGVPFAAAASLKSPAASGGWSYRIQEAAVPMRPCGQWPCAYWALDTAGHGNEGRLVLFPTHRPGGAMPRAVAS